MGLGSSDWPGCPVLFQMCLKPGHKLQVGTYGYREVSWLSRKNPSPAFESWAASQAVIVNRQGSPEAS